MTQKAQSTAQPVCEERQTVNLSSGGVLDVGRRRRRGSSRAPVRARGARVLELVDRREGAGSPGMKTASMSAPSASRSPYLTLPSERRLAARRSPAGGAASRARAARGARPAELADAGASRGRRAGAARRRSAVAAVPRRAPSARRQGLPAGRASAPRGSGRQRLGVRGVASVTGPTVSGPLTLRLESARVVRTARRAADGAGGAPDGAHAPCASGRCRPTSGSADP